MSKVGPKGRSFERISMHDLRRMRDIAKSDMQEFFERRPDWGQLYADRVLCVTLCQGAALHYINGATGINDIDLYTFFRTHPHRRWYAKRLTSYDLGYGKFGQSLDKPHWTGRRVDCMARGIQATDGGDPALAVQRWLSDDRSKSARLLTGKAVVQLEPEIGRVIRPVRT